MPFRVDCDASEHTTADILSQADRPVAFFSITSSKSEGSYPIVEKDALAIIESVRYWSHFLHRSRFLLVTDQKALSFMFCQSGRGKIKNTKLQVWRAELGNLSTISFIVLVVITLCLMHCLAPLRLHQLLSIRLKAHCPILLACTNNLAIRVSLDCSISCAL